MLKLIASSPSPFAREEVRRGYLELDWRDRYANLARLADKLFKRPAFADTVPIAA